MTRHCQSVNMSALQWLLARTWDASETQLGADTFNAHTKYYTDASNLCCCMYKTQNYLAATF